MAEDTTPDDALTDASEAIETEPIVRLFSRPAAVRLLVALVDASGARLSPGDITDVADVSRNAWYDNRDLLLEYGLVEEAGKVGNSTVYRARMGSEPVTAFEHLYDALLEEA